VTVKRTVSAVTTASGPTSSRSTHRAQRSGGRDDGRAHPGVDTERGEHAGELPVHPHGLYVEVFRGAPIVKKTDEEDDS